MKKFLPLAAPAMLLMLSLCAPAHAQGQSRQTLDNFDTASGVNLPEPPPPPTPAPARKLRMTAMHRAELARSRPALKATTEASTAAALPNAVLSPGASAKALDGYTTGDAKVDSYIADSGVRHGVDPVLLYAIMHRESAFKKRALSNKGARGLMQLMPGTAARFGVRDIFDPAQNIEGGARYMGWLLRRFDGDVRLALAGYNAGEGAVDKYGRRVPPYRETQEYVRRISERYSLMRDPDSARRAPVVNRAQATAANQTAQPLPALYETNVYSVRLPDGKLMLVSQ
jgi:soluble lytic murein transglycosylase-like protein